MSKVKECRACGQGFDEDNNLVGNAVPSVRCSNGQHEGPIDRVAQSTSQAESSRIAEAKALYCVAIKVGGSKSKMGFRARIYVLAGQCMAFYCGAKGESIKYEGNDLIIKLLFESMDRCRQFYEDLHAIHYRFVIVMPLVVLEAIHPVPYTSPLEPVLSSDYSETKTDSPPHSLCGADYGLKSVGGSQEEILSVCTVSDPYSVLQMIENPDHPFLRGLKMYRCHLEAQASNKRQKLNQNNILHMSWPMHQRFDGLNLVGGKHMVPSIAFNFLKSEKETMEVVSGYQVDKYRVTFAIETNGDLETLNAIGGTLKQGSEFDSPNNRWITFVHVDKDDDFKTFLQIKYKIAKKLWQTKAPIGEEIEDTAMEELEQNAVEELKLSQSQEF